MLVLLTELFVVDVLIGCRRRSSSDAGTFWTIHCLCRRGGGGIAPLLDRAGQLGSTVVGQGALVEEVGALPVGRAGDPTVSIECHANPSAAEIGGGGFVGSILPDPTPFGWSSGSGSGLATNSSTTKQTAVISKMIQVDQASSSTAARTTCRR